MSKALKPTTRTSIFWVYLFLIGLCYVAGYIHSGVAFKDFINADALYLPSVFKDLFEEGGSIQDWYLTPAPYFFPDWIIYGLGYSLNRNIIPTLILTSTIQLASFLFLFYRQLKHLGFGDRLSNWGTIVLFAFFVFSSEPYKTLALLGTFHFGAIIGSLLTLQLVIQQLQDYRHKTLGLIVFLCTILTLSDRIFLVYFVVPCLLTLIFWGIVQVFRKRKQVLMSSLIHIGGIGIGAAIGYALYPLVIPHPTVYDVQFSLANWQNSYANVQGYLKDFGIVWVTLVGIGIFTKICTRSNKEKQHSDPLFLLFCWLSAGMTIVIQLLQNIPTSDRYFQSSFWFPVLASIVCILRLIKQFNRRGSFYSILDLVSLGALLTYLVFTFPNQGITKPLRKVNCLEKVLQTHNAEYGVGTYWDSKFTSAMLSDVRQVATVFSNLEHRNWITTANNQREFYDFAIVTKPPHHKLHLDERLLIALNGEPKATQVCSGIKVLVYPKNTMKLEGFEVGDQGIWRACDLVLPKRSSPLENCKHQARKGKAGNLIKALDIKLVAGTYRVDLHYSSTNAEGDPKDTWQINFVERSQEHRMKAKITRKPMPFFSDSIPDSGGRETIQQKEITIEHSQQGLFLDVLLHYSGSGDFIFDKLVLTRIK